MTRLCLPVLLIVLLGGSGFVAQGALRPPRPPQGVVIRNSADTDNVVPVVCGVNVTSGLAAVNDLAQANPAGTILCFPAGTYALDETIEAKPNQQFIGSPGAILDGHNAIATAFHGYGGNESYSVQHVTVSGFEIKNFTDTAIAMGWYWTISNNQVHDNLIGVTMNGYSTLSGGRVYSNAQYGINGGPGDTMTISGIELDHNNTSNECGGGCPGDAGGSKIVGTSAGMTGLVWRNNNVHDNTGPGIWSDGNVHDALYEGNTVTNNSVVGIFHELSWNAIIRNNRLTDNAAASIGLSCSFGSQLHLNVSQDVEVYGNIVIGNHGENAMCAVASNRSDAVAPFPTGMQNLNVHDNTFKLKGTAVSGLVVESGEVATGASFSTNAWFVPDTTSAWWTWLTATRTWTQWQGVGNDTGGTRTLW